MRRCADFGERSVEPRSLNEKSSVEFERGVEQWLNLVPPALMRDARSMRASVARVRHRFTE
jgi:hypothetical protein